MNKKSLFISIIALFAVLFTACSDKDDDPELSAPATFTVTFDSQGGSPVTAKTDVVSGATIEAPTAPTKGNFTFVKWVTEKDGSTEWVFATNTVTKNTTLYAQWNDTRVEVTAGSAVNAPATADESDEVEFTFESGAAAKLAGLGADDFIVSEGAEIEDEDTDIVVDNGTVTIKISFEANAGDEKEYIVSINPNSLLIKDAAATNTVTVTQEANARVKLTIAEDEITFGDNGEKDIVFAFDGTFTDNDKTTLETVADAADHFIVTGGTAEITAIVVDATSEYTVTITIENLSDDGTEYTVSINPDSTLIRGDVTVTLTYEAED
ncbi:MAG: InlB B-repeat-containing protein [Treponema sp.]|jgi:uncharacterized repeat protein (TIGR02543 family)|nr:InlB B-repeat-containing protein [Treponema sp.]